MPTSTRAMDKLSLISGALFFAADLFAIASLSVPRWIESYEGGGKTHIGLLMTCMTFLDRDEICVSPQPMRAEFVLTFLCILVGICCVTVTIVLLIGSYWKYSVMQGARWAGFVAVIFFCIAAVMFPVGFDMDQIGGQPYQLPNSFQVGVSYIFFVLALWITVISELFAGKVCLPHF